MDDGLPVFNACVAVDLAVESLAIVGVIASLAHAYVREVPPLVARLRAWAAVSVVAATVFIATQNTDLVPLQAVTLVLKSGDGFLAGLYFLENFLHLLAVVELAQFPDKLRTLFSRFRVFMGLYYVVVAIALVADGTNAVLVAYNLGAFLLVGFTFLPTAVTSIKLSRTLTRHIKEMTPTPGSDSTLIAPRDKPQQPPPNLKLLHKVTRNLRIFGVALILVGAPIVASGVRNLLGVSGQYHETWKNDHCVAINGSNWPFVFITLISLYVTRSSDAPIRKSKKKTQQRPAAGSSGDSASTSTDTHTASATGSTKKYATVGRSNRPQVKLGAVKDEPDREEAPERARTVTHEPQTA